MGSELTDPYGPTFISYRRSQLIDVNRLACTLQTCGVPIWQDVSDLGAVPTETEIASVLGNPRTGSAIIWVTGDVDKSHVIKRLEYPEILNRARSGDAFFVIGVAIGGLGYDDVARILDDRILASSIGSWNLRILPDVDDPGQILDLVAEVVRNRLNAIRLSLDSESTVNMSIGTRAKPSRLGTVLCMDWTGSFADSDPSQSDWDLLLLPSLKIAASTMAECLPDRTVVISGNIHLPVAVALGRAFATTGPIEAVWSQVNPDQSTDKWSVSISPGSDNFQTQELNRSSNGTDLAILLSVTANAESAFAATFEKSRHFCAVLNIKPEDSVFPVRLDSASADSLARRAVDAIKDSTSRYRCSGIIHLFIAGPAGLAFLIGQRSNALGPIQTYEHIDDDIVGHYSRSVLLPSTR